MRVLVLRSAPRVELLGPAPRVIEQRQFVHERGLQLEGVPGGERAAGAERAERRVELAAVAVSAQSVSSPWSEARQPMAWNASWRAFRASRSEASVPPTGSPDACSSFAT